MREKIASVGLVASMLLGVLGTAFGISTIVNTQSHPADQIPNVYNTYNNQTYVYYNQTNYNQTFVNNTYVNNTRVTQQNTNIMYSEHFMNTTISPVHQTKQVAFSIPMLNRTRILHVVTFYENWNKTTSPPLDDTSCFVYFSEFGWVFYSCTGAVTASAGSKYTYAADLSTTMLANGTGCSVVVSAYTNSLNHPDPFEVSVAIWYKTW